MKRVLFFLLFLAVMVSLEGCRRHLSSPESVDPVYLDLKSMAEKTLATLAEVQKDLDKAKDLYETAPIRTGQRQDAREDYFEAQKKQNMLIEKYRYQALHMGRRQKEARAAYELAFKENRPWPDMEAYKIYQTEKRLAEAPKEWDPKDRIKKRELAHIKVEEKAEE